MLLTRADIERELASLHGWTCEADRLVRTFTFGGFPEAVAFVGRLVPGAEAADHHPDLMIHYRRVTVEWWTHDEGGVTGKDVAGARMTDAAAAVRSPGPSDRRT
jgi:4a-hydroxytetrahydrobiopterin dehydratase